MVNFEPLEGLVLARCRQEGESEDGVGKLYQRASRA